MSRLRAGVGRAAPGVILWGGAEPGAPPGTHPGKLGTRLLGVCKGGPQSWGGCCWEWSRGLWESQGIKQAGIWGSVGFGGLGFGGVGSGRL